MKTLLQWFIILIVLALLVMESTNANAYEGVYGIQIEQRALDVFTLASQRLSEVLGSQDLQQVISVKAKIIVSDVISSGDITEQLSQMIFTTRIEIFKASPNLVRVNLTSSFGDIEFIVTESESIAVLPDDGVFANTNIPELLPARLIFPEDEGGLFTLINLMGGVPFGSLLSPPPIDVISPGMDVGFVEELDPSDLRATVRYRGKDKTEAGVVHVISILTTGMGPNRQSIKIWVLEDTMDLYQISIEDERGTEVFVVIDEIIPGPVIPEGIFSLDTSNLVEVSEDELRARFLLKIVTSPTIESPMILDLYASSDQVARTGTATIMADGFDPQDKEHELLCEMEYRSPGGSWTTLERIEYAGLSPLGHWDATFAPNETAELGDYSFRVRYTNSSGNTSEWLEAMDLVKVTPAPPRVVQTKPIKTENDVPISTDITVTFNKPMDRATVENAFSVATGVQRATGSFTWDENTLIFSPSPQLRYSRTYLVRITGRAKSLDGIGLDGNYDIVSDGSPYDDYIWTFTTAAAPPMLAFAEPEQPVYKGDIFDVKVVARYVSEMHKFSFKMTFDPEILEVQKINKASFTAWRSRPKLVEEADLWVKPVIDNSAGVITIACDGTRAGGVSGSGNVATISFKAIGAGTTSLESGDASVVDSKGKPIDMELRAAEIQVMEFHPRDVNHDGVVNILDFVASEEDQNFQMAPRPAQYALAQNYPNPFNPETWIPYQLARPSHVAIRIYRSTGEIVRTLDLGRKEAGFYTDRTKAAYWDGTDDTGQKLSSGIYFYTIQTDGFAATRKMLLSK